MGLHFCPNFNSNITFHVTTIKTSDASSHYVPTMKRGGNRDLFVKEVGIEATVTYNGGDYDGE